MNTRQLLLAALLAGLTATTADAQFPSRDPHLGYAFPAGGQRGSQFQVTLGGQYLDGATRVLVSDEGISAEVRSHKKPLTIQQVNRLREKLQEAQKQLQENPQPSRLRRGFGFQERFIQAAEEAGVTREQLEALREFREQRQDPKRQENPQIAEELTIQVAVDSSVDPGQYDLRVLTPAGLTNPIRFEVGTLAEVEEDEPNDQPGGSDVVQTLPIVLNGQILPGDVDRFQFRANAGQTVTVAAQARALIPYLADAVPGWFQATLAVYDDAGHELAYADDYRFHPDPVLFVEIPEDGRYVVEITDAVYRGREDFVYRIYLGELPFITSVFPLGHHCEEPVEVELSGWNLPTTEISLDSQVVEPGIHDLPTKATPQGWGTIPFATGTLPEIGQAEPNDDSSQAQSVALPCIVNGRIDHEGDWDVFRFEGKAGQQVVVEVLARRLNSPMDSVLILSDATGKRVAFNDDHEDKAASLTTHHADSRMDVTLPKDGLYEVRLGDMQSKGGSEYAYRLRISDLQPDFQLRIVPASVNARPGSAVPITVYALRRDGFSGDITLALNDAPAGFALSGARVPAGQDQVRLTLSVPPFPRDEPIALSLEGQATVQGQTLRRRAIPAEDQMQAFIYRHLVPTDLWLVSVQGRGSGRVPVRLFAERPVQLPLGGTEDVHFFLRNVPAALGQMKLELSDAPDGVSLSNVSRLQHGVAIQLQVDSEKAVVGLNGNLIIEVFVERKVQGPSSAPRGNTRRFSLGMLPAVPFEIVDLSARG